MKDKYHIFCKSAHDMPVFSMPWWLDAVCGKQGWDVILVERNNEIVASFPYYIKHNAGMRFLAMPPLTQKLGVYIKYPENQSTVAKLSYEKDVMNEIITRLPKHDFFRVNFDYRYTNWLPFYWQKFSQTTRYTYVIEDISDVDRVYQNFDSSKKRNIKKARRLVEVGFDLPCKDFYENHRMNLQKQGEKISYSFDIFRNLYEAVYREGRGRAIYCRDKQGNLHAAYLVVWDHVSAFNLVTNIDPDYRDSGASSLLIYEMIQYLSGKVKKFDFEGSMIEGVERSYRRFGTEPKPYFRIYKGKSKRFIILNGLKDIWDTIHTGIWV